MSVKHLVYCLAIVHAICMSGWCHKWWYLQSGSFLQWIQQYSQHMNVPSSWARSINAAIHPFCYGRLKMATNSWLLLTLWDEFNYLPQKKIIWPYWLAGQTEGDRSNVLGLPRLHQSLRVSILDYSMELLLLSCEKAHATHIKRNQSTQLTALAEFRSRDQNQLIRLVSEPSEGAVLQLKSSSPSWSYAE